MLTAKECKSKYGDPKKNESKFMVLWDIPSELEIGNVIPKRLYCNKDLVKPLSAAFKNLIAAGLVSELKTWDGCFNIRPTKSGKSPSLHSWGVAIDVNAASNGYNKQPTLSKKFVECFKRAGFDWGGDWTTKDGMHFQLSKI
jgi:hypothetical protein